MKVAFNGFWSFGDVVIGFSIIRVVVHLLCDLLALWWRYTLIWVFWYSYFFHRFLMFWSLVGSLCWIFCVTGVINLKWNFHFNRSSWTGLLFGITEEHLMNPFIHYYKFKSLLKVYIFAHNGQTMLFHFNIFLYNAIFYWLSFITVARLWGAHFFVILLNLYCRFYLKNWWMMREED